MSPPLISCIVPCFNSQEFVSQALDSIFAQTYRPIEVIVVDDGSSDDTLKIVDRYAGDVIVVTQPDRGPAATRNQGMTAATGQFVAFLDADDLWRPEKLDRQYACFVEDPSLQYCISHAQMFWTSSLENEGRHHAGQPRSGSIPGYATTTLLARRSVFDKVGLLDPSLRFGDAVDWFMRASDMNIKMKVVEEVLTDHRMHESNLSRRGSEGSRREYLQLVRRRIQKNREGEI